jgi:MFS family permease
MIAIKSKFFYGWIILAIGFLVMGVMGSCVFYSFGIFLKPITADLGISRGEATVAYSIMMALQGLFSPLVAIVINKFGTRKPMTLGLTLATIGLALMSTATQLWHLYLFYGILIGAGVALGHFLPVSTMVTFWFTRKRPLAIGILMAGVGIGTLIMAPVIARMISSLGWRTTWLVLAGIVLILAVVPSAIFARNKPEDMGLLSDGVQANMAHDSYADETVSFIAVVDWEIKPALRTITIWMITIINSANVFCMMMMNNHQVAHLTDMGFSPVIAASTLGFLGGTSAIGRLSGGALGQRINPRYLMAIAFMLEAISLFIFLNAHTTTAVYAYVLLFGFAAGTIVVLHITMLGNYYGSKSYAFLASTVMVISTIVGASSPVLGGYIYDAVQSYKIPFTICIVASIIGGICALMARPPRYQASLK